MQTHTYVSQTCQYVAISTTQYYYSITSAQIRLEVQRYDISQKPMPTRFLLEIRFQMKMWKQLITHHNRINAWIEILTKLAKPLSLRDRNGLSKRLKKYCAYACGSQ